MIKEYTELIPDELAQRFYDYGFSVAMGNAPEAPRGIWTSLKWHDSLVINSGLVLCVRPTEQLEKELEDVLIERGILDLTTDRRITETATAINVWGRGSFICSHPDGNYSKAVTVYLNKDWNHDKGGFFHWQDDVSGNWNVIAPTFNKAVVNGGGILHGISPVQSDFRITLQVFVHKINP
jgi:Rps23 Pro-64 3,4-dihydroxylase Tpa1-like proline 4-hydroxylase